VLDQLHVRDLALVEDAWLEPGAGLTVLTGETGAGKTVLVEALMLLLGERGDATLVRAGASEAVVEGRFVIDGREVVARRRVTADGRSRCTLDGEMTTVSGLAEALGGQVDLHGQHDHQALLRPASHVGYLDRFGGKPIADALAGYRACREAYRAAGERLAESEAALADREVRSERARFLVDEVDAVSVSPGEDVALQARLPALRHGERLASAASNAFAAVRGDGGASDGLAAAMAALRGVEGLDPAIDALADELREAAAALDDAGSRLRDRGEGVEFDPEALNEAETRLAMLSSLKKKYGPDLDDVIAARDEARATLDALERGEEGLDAARDGSRLAEESLQKAAGVLFEARTAFVPTLVERLGAMAAELAMRGARFEVAFEDLPPAAWGADGPQRIEFMYAPGEGEPARPLARIGSGGEVSRVMLALKGVLGHADEVPVLVFDEVDAGIGGQTALAVGRRLADLAVGRQVLVVTHLAQVAAFADRHLVVTKDDSAGRPVTTVREAAGDERVAEVARMLAGEGTQTALAHARELLAAAVSGR